MPRHARSIREAATKHLSKTAASRHWLKLPLIEADPRWKKPFRSVDALARAILWQAQRQGRGDDRFQVETAIASDRFHYDTLSRRATTRPSAPAACPATSCWRCATWPRASSAAKIDAEADGDAGQRRDHRRADADPRHRPLDGGNDADVPPRPPGRAAGRRPRHPAKTRRCWTKLDQMRRRRNCWRAANAGAPFPAPASFYLWRIADAGGAQAKRRPSVRRIESCCHPEGEAGTCCSLAGSKAGPLADCSGRHPPNDQAL